MKGEQRADADESRRDAGTILLRCWSRLEGQRVVSAPRSWLLDL